MTTNFGNLLNAGENSSGSRLFGHFAGDCTLLQRNKMHEHEAFQLHIDTGRGVEFSTVV